MQVPDGIFNFHPRLFSYISGIIDHTGDCLPGNTGCICHIINRRTPAARRIITFHRTRLYLLFPAWYNRVLGPGLLIITKRYVDPAYKAAGNIVQKRPNCCHHANNNDFEYRQDRYCTNDPWKAEDICQIE